jgi:C-terminal processing protease CtpA/Prc
LAINGVPVKALFSRLRHYLSADTDYMLGGFLEFYLEVLLFFEWGELNEYSLKVGQQDQAVIQVKAVNKEQLEKRQAELPASLVLGWERQARMLPDGVAYLRPGPFFNTESSAADPWDNRAFSAFIEQSFETFKARKPSALLIDMRDNPGGDNSFSDLMLRWIADQPFRFASTFQVKVSEAFRQSNDARLQAQSDQGVDKNSVSYRYQQAYQKRANGEVFDFDIPLVQPGPKRLNTRVFMLVNRHSYSNAVTTAAMAQDYGFATILGEETSDLAVTYGAMEHFTLSHTGIQVGFPKALIVRPSGDRTVRGVVPDHLIKTPVVESVDDPVLKAALRHIHSEKNES